MDNDEFFDCLNDLDKLTFGFINDETDFKEDKDPYNSTKPITEEEIEAYERAALLGLGETEEDNAEEDDDSKYFEDEDNTENNPSNSNVENTTNTNTTNNIYNKNFLSQAKEKFMQNETNSHRNTQQNKESSTNQNNDINKMVASIENAVAKESEFYKINFINLDRYMRVEITAKEKEEFLNYLKGKYDNKRVRELFYMMTFETKVEFKKKNDPSGNIIKNAIDLDFIKEVQTFCKKENYILTPVYNRDDLINGEMYVYPTYNRMFIYENSKIDRKHIYISRDTFNKFVATELARYCYNSEGILIFYPKGYTPKYILNENILFIQKYISDDNKARELYRF